VNVDRRRLFETVCWLCPEILVRSVTPGKWATTDESDLWYELIACILGSQVSFEVAQAAAERLRSANLVDPSPPPYPDHFENEVAECLRSSRYRFPVARARQIRQTRQTIYGSGLSLHSILKSAPGAREARTELVARAAGVGPKQASLFLRNVGFTLDLGIIDAHVLRYMEFMGISSTTRREGPGPNLACYENNETALREHATDAGYAIGHMDWAIWVVMRSIRQTELAWMS
jgi:N-glycosylase/DNA lyase